MRQQSGEAGTDYRFTGQQQEASTGLTYLRARHYDPSTGRFLSKDPFPGFAALPATQHPYGYALNNPTNLTDPSGEIAPLLIIAGLALAGGVAGGGAYAATHQDNFRAGEFALWTGGGAVIGGAIAGATVVATGAGAAASALAVGQAALASRTMGVRAFQSFSALQRALPHPGAGNVYRHIVEQRLAGRVFPPTTIHNTQNVAAVSRWANQEIANYYSRIRPFTGGRPVRQWLGGQPFTDQHRFGLEILGRVLRGDPLP